MEAFGTLKMTAELGSRITVVFSHPTNMPPVLRPRDLHKMVHLSPAVLMSNTHLSFWTDPFTLVIYYPAVNEDSLYDVSANDVVVTFIPPPGDLLALLSSKINSTEVCV